MAYWNSDCENDAPTKARHAKPSAMTLSCVTVPALLLVACGSGGGEPQLQTSSANALVAAPQPSPTPSPQPSGSASACAAQTIPVTQFEGLCSSEATEVEGITITASRSSCIAPCGVFFEVGLGNQMDAQRPRHQLTFHWDFGDPEAQFEALPDDFPASFKDATLAQGQMAGHVFEKPGSYQVQLFVTDGQSKYATNSAIIKVEDPEIVYAGDRTVCYSNNQDFVGCPSGARHFDDITSAFAAVRRDRTRVLLRSGEATLIDVSPSFRDLKDIQVGSFGEGANPILEIDAWASSSIFRPRDTDGLTIFGLEMRGDYDPTTGLGENYNEGGIGNLGTVRNITVFRNTFKGLANALAWIDQPDGVIVADNTVSDWYDYGVYDTTPNRTAYIGNSIKQNPNAVSGAGSKDRNMIPRWSDHGPIRTAYVKTLVISQNDMFSNTGWSSDGRAHQPTIRYNTLGSGNHFGVINRNRLEGGFSVASLDTQNTDTIANKGTVVFERNLLLGTDNTSQMISLGFGNTTIRNNVAIMPNVPNTFNPFQYFVRAGKNASNRENLEAPIRVTHNSIINTQDRNVYEFRVTDSFKSQSFDDFRSESNLVYAPWAPNVGDFTDVWPLDESDHFRPIEGSSAIGGATENAFVIDTFDGKIRSGERTIGALESR